MTAPVPDDGRAVAIVGMACRFPDASTPQDLWRNSLARRTSFRPVPGERWSHPAFLTEGRDPHGTPCNQAAFLDNVEDFAARHFGFSPRRAQSTDAQQRLILEVAREALIDAGLEARPLQREASAAFVGVGVSEYSRMMVMGVRARQLRMGDFGAASPDAERLTGRVIASRSYMIPGSLLSMCGSLIAQTFDFGGPCVAVDAACAASLVAVVQAVTYLRGLPPRRPGDPAPVALAGGVYLMLLPDNMVGFTRVGALARTACRPFDRAAEGFLLGEGAGLVTLKRFDDAKADGDRIYAVLRGVAWNSDGRSESPMTPRLSGQIALLRSGFEDAAVPRSSIGYVEAHGTGTLVGDRAELEALSEVYAGVTERPHIGSIKANIGHSLTAAGVAGVMRAALACYTATLPPHAGWEAWPDSIEPHLRFPIDTAPRPWTAPTRRATVSAFGFGGLNAFTVLESAPPLPVSPPWEGPLLFCCSAPTPALLDAHLGDLSRALAHLEGEALARAAYTLSVTRAVSRQAAVFVARDAGAAVDAIASLRDALQTPPVAPLRVGEAAVLGPVAAAAPDCTQPPPCVCTNAVLGAVPADPLLHLGLAAVLRHPVDLEAAFAPGLRRVTDLPISGLERERHWAVERRAGEAAAPPAETVSPAPPRASAPTASADAPRTHAGETHSEALIDVIARIGGRPRTSVRPEHRLMADLGFDSVLFAELVTHLSRTYALQMPFDFWSADPRIADIPTPRRAKGTGAFPEVLTLSLASHPFLRDHAFDGRPFLPLASAIDLLAWSQDLRPPFALRDIRVTRGVLLMGERSLRVTREGDRLTLLDGRGEGRAVSTFEATLAHEVPSPPTLEALAQARLQTALDLDTFYREHTFHGPRVQGVVAVTAHTPASIEGRVRTRAHHEWQPFDPRPGWHADPTMIDGAFQLALYHAACVSGKGLLPQHIDSLVLLAAPDPGSVEVRIEREADTPDEVRATFVLSQHGRCIGWMRGVKARVVDARTPSRTWRVAEADRRIDAFPEVRALDERKAAWGDLYPYFRAHDSVAGAHVRIDGQTYISFAHYDYLGLNGHPDITAAARHAIDRHGTTAGASRLVAGELALHGELERALAAFLDVDDAVAMVSGHATNLSVISALAGPSDLVLTDALCHDSIVQGAIASRAARRTFPHNDVAALEGIVAEMRPDFRRVLIITEGVFSMDGDVPDLAALVDLKERYGCLLMVDEAHALGVLGATGRGLAEHCGVPARSVDVWMGTFSKALVSCGGYVAGSHALVRLLKHAASGFVYSVGMTPSAAASALAALRVLQREPDRVTRLRARATSLAHDLRAAGFDVGKRFETPIIPLVLGDDMRCLRVTASLTAEGIHVLPIVYPAVERAASRLRFFVTASHTPDDLSRAAGAVTRALAREHA